MSFSKFGRQRLSKTYGKGSGDEQEEEDEDDPVSREVICRDKLVLRPTVDKVSNLFLL